MELSEIANVSERFLLAQGKPYRIIKSVGSGINYNNPALQELVTDLIQIVTVFSAKLNGKRKYKLQEFKKELQHESTHSRSGGTTEQKSK